ncbi:MAG: DUF1579 family protein [Acidobacteriota bacterium]
MELQMPSPGTEHKQLAALAGKWSGDEIMHPSPMGPGGKSVGFTDARMSADDFYLITDYHQEVGGKRTYHGHGVIGYDTFGKRYVWYWVDSMGMPPCNATVGQFGGSDFVFESDTPHGKTRYVYSLKSADRYTFKIEISPDGGKTWAPFMEGDYKREK